MIEPNENHEFFDIIAEYFDDIGEVKCLAVYLGFTKSSIVYAQTKEYPDIRAMSKLFMKGYVAQYGIWEFIEVLKKKIGEKMNKCFPLKTDKTVYENIEVSNNMTDFKVSKIPNTFPPCELLIDMAFKLLESPENITSRFFNYLHCKHFTDVNCYVEVSGHQELRKLLIHIDERCTDTYQIAHYRGKDVCTMETQCRKDDFEIYFELLCHWKGYSFSDQLNYEIISLCFLDYGNRSMAEKIRCEYEDFVTRKSRYENEVFEPDVR
ncbi:hypothetical protein Ahia01_001097300 [Argonauta hians]